MSNTRIEREARKYAKNRFTNAGETRFKRFETTAFYGYQSGALSEKERAAPVVKALEAIQREMILPAHLEELLHKTLLTYKADV